MPEAPSLQAMPEADCQIIRPFIFALIILFRRRRSVVLIHLPVFFVAGRFRILTRITGLLAVLIGVLLQQLNFVTLAAFKVNRRCVWIANSQADFNSVWLFDWFFRRLIDWSPGPEFMERVGLLIIRTNSQPEAWKWQGYTGMRNSQKRIHTYLQANEIAWMPTDVQLDLVEGQGCGPALRRCLARSLPVRGKRYESDAGHRWSDSYEPIFQRVDARGLLTYGQRYLIGLPDRVEVGQFAAYADEGIGYEFWGRETDLENNPSSGQLWFFSLQSN